MKKSTNSTSTMSNSATGVRWNLSDYYQSINDPNIEKDLQNALKKAKSFERKYRGIFSRKPAPTGLQVSKMLQEYEKILILRDKPHIFAHLLFASNTQDPAYGRLLQQMQQRSTEISKHLIFLTLEWCATDDKLAKKIIEDKACARYRHFLEASRRYKPHLLSEPEEKIIDELENTGSRAFMRLFDELQGAAKFTLKTKGKAKSKEKVRELSEQQALALLYDPDREVRKAAAEALTEGFKAMLKPLTFIFNTLVQNHSIMDRLRNYPDPMASRNLANEIDSKTVEALLNVCCDNYSLVERYYRMKRKLLGLKTLYDYDRYAPISADLPRCNWKEARDIVSSSYHTFSPILGKIVDEFFNKNWIDAELRPGKRGGAFCCSGPTDLHPYVLMNYTENLRDVSVLAHELGHGVHGYLSRKQGYLQCDTPLTIAETASVFGEMLTFNRLLEMQNDPKVKLSLLCSKIEDTFATVFRQVCMTRFEQRLHEAHRKEGELTSETISQFWMDSNKAMFGDSVQLTEGYSYWWSYIGHFIHSPFYCYAYAFGELLVLSLYALYRQEGKKFVPKYIALLEAGGSESPQALTKKMGLDISKASFWKNGIDLIEEMLHEAEKLASLI